ncbi:Na+/H+ antiporter subunit A [Microbacterium sp.]|uniref:Na+/H+ antiporter subunit A n=1 Tax=Microbacterium sp. TaxID=51671 RepID=UPI003A8D9B6D
MLILLAAFALVPLTLPLLVRAIGARAFYVAAAVPAIAFVHAVLQAPAVLAGGVPIETFEWIPSLGIRLSLRMDLLSWVLTLIVTGVGALVLLYCRWYFDGQLDGVGQFSAVLLGFAGAMYGLVLVDDLVVLVMLWEVTSVLSYLLIGFYHRRGASRRSALQALLVTTVGGLVMLVGVVLLVIGAGTTSLSGILAHPPHGPVVDAAIVLILVGALSKSAIFPFHFWLPGAMAAPTPVSAYLHAAAMVKAGIYLIARLAPAFALIGPWRPILISLGAFTMLLGGVQALRETDLKRILAYGTVSQLGLLTVVLGYGTRDAALAGLALLVSHALFKSSLFLIVGVIDRQLSTRDIGELSGLGRQAPVLAVAAIVAVCSMAGVIPTIGFVAKEGALAALLHESAGGAAWGVVALIGMIAGSMLTAAYGIRFVWGAFWRKKARATEEPGTDAAAAARGSAGPARYMPDTEWPSPPVGFVATPIVLAALTLVAGFAAGLLDHALALYADTVAAETPGVAASAPAHLALWHGLEPALWISLGTLVVGALAFAAAHALGWDRRAHLLPFSAVDAYNLVLRGIARLSVAVTRVTQRGSLPIYVGTIFVVLVVAEGTVLVAGPDWRVQLDAWQSPVQPFVAPVMIVAGLIAVRARKRYTGVVLVSVTGMGMITLFATSGAPDLALTQVLVETVTMIAFALVLRRIPSRMGEHHASVWPVARAVLGAAVGLTMAAVATVATGARQAKPISESFPELAYRLGHGTNVVNVALVDLRGWDTMGELSVLILAATGVASLVFVTHRADLLSQLSALPEAVGRSRRVLIETDEGLKRQTRGGHVEGRRAWLVGGQRVRAGERSIMLEVIVRILFHTIIVVSLYVLFAGHNLPGGGFAGGLIAGIALVMRYIAGGRYELGAAAPTDAGRFLGGGMVLAVACAVVPVFFGQAPLTSAVLEADIPVLGHLEFVTSTIFDIGVYLVVIGLVLDVLRSLGAEVDRQRLEQAEQAEQTGQVSAR